jgi:enamine deaminase RidA (YjgF/YER057c/UK114 family)
MCDLPEPREIVERGVISLEVARAAREMRLVVPLRAAVPFYAVLPPRMPWRSMMICSKRLFALAAVLAFAPIARSEPVIERLKPEGLFNVPSFSQAVTAKGGKFVFVSGQVAWDAGGKPVPGDLEMQTRLTYENLKRALAAAGASFEDVVKFTVYVKNLDTEKWRRVSKVRNEYLTPGRAAASTMIGVTGLVYDELLIEIEAVALVPD